MFVYWIRQCWWCLFIEFGSFDDVCLLNSAVLMMFIYWIRQCWWCLLLNSAVLMMFVIEFGSVDDVCLLNSAVLMMFVIEFGSVDDVCLLNSAVLMMFVIEFGSVDDVCYWIRQCGVLILFNLASVLLVFPAVVSLDLTRRQHHRVDLFCCFSRWVEKKVFSNVGIWNERNCVTLISYFNRSDQHAVQQIIFRNLQLTDPSYETDFFVLLT